MTFVESRDYFNLSKEGKITKNKQDKERTMLQNEL